MSEAYNKPTDEQIASDVERELDAIRAQALNAHPMPERTDQHIADTRNGVGFWSEVWKGMKEGWANGAEESCEERQHRQEFEQDRQEYEDALLGVTLSDNPQYNRYWYISGRNR